MSEQKIKLPSSLALAVYKVLGIPHRLEKFGLVDTSFTEEELASVKKLTFVNPALNTLKGIELLPNLEVLNVDSNINSEYSPKRMRASIGFDDAVAIGKCKKLKQLKVTNQSNLEYLDVSQLTNLECLEISNNEMLEEIDGLGNLNKLWSIDLYGNNRLKYRNDKKREMNGIYSVIKNNPELCYMRIDSLMFPDAIGYRQNGTYDGEMLKRIEQIGDVTWAEKFGKNKIIKLNTQQIITMHNKACQALKEYVPNGAPSYDIVMGIEKYLAENVKYDYQSITGEKTSHTSSQKIEIENKNVNLAQGPLHGANGAFNAFMYGTCVCQGYTRAMQYMLRLKGINSHDVACIAGRDTIGMADSNKEDKYTVYRLPYDGYHSIICIDDMDSLFCDPCWDAGRYQRGDKSFKYALRTKSEISQDHTLSFDEANISNDSSSVSRESLSDSIKRGEIFMQVSKKNLNKVAQNIRGAINMQNDRNKEKEEYGERGE